MSMLLYVLVAIIDVVAVMDILKSSKDNEKKILWIVVVVLMPLLGPLLYYVVGRK